MKQEIKEQWITDLTSGEFEQGKQFLEKDGKFCCLGVLCKRAAEAGIVSRVVENGKGFYDGNASNLPPAVITWAGLEDQGALGEYDVRNKDGNLEIGHALTMDNDNSDHDFTRIAQTIRELF